jgi:apolipoprotein N-acyltransferase
MQILNQISYALYSLQGKKLFFCVFMCGAIAALGFAPVFWVPLTFVGFSVFFFLLKESPSFPVKPLFWMGWFFGLGYFTVGLYWIALALHVDWMKFGWLFPLALIGVPSGLAVTTGVVAYLTTFIPEGPFLRYLAFGLFWSVLEWVRGHIFPLFPWLLISDIWLFSPQLSQTLSVIGSYGLGLVTVYLLTLPALARRDALLGGLCLLLILWFWGEYRLKTNPIQCEAALTLYLVQPNIPQEQKWDPELTRHNLEKLYALSQNSLQEQIFIIWPESAVPFTVQSDSQFSEQLGTLLKKKDYLAFGEPRVTGEGEQKKIYNSIGVINQRGQIIGVYDKSRLVPFGEYIPFRAIIPASVSKLTYGPLDYSAGEGQRTIFLPDIPGFSALVCYEIIFPGAVTPHHSLRPAWILNLTNDGWYLNSSGPYQHFQMARARAIEEGLPVVRVANTGISAVIDPYGRVLKKLPYGVEGIIVEFLPKSISGATLYVFWRDIPYLLSVFLLFVLILMWPHYRKSRVDSKNDRLH